MSLKKILLSPFNLVKRGIQSAWDYQHSDTFQDPALGEMDREMAALESQTLKIDAESTYEPVAGAKTSAKVKKK